MRDLRNLPTPVLDRLTDSFGADYVASPRTAFSRAGHGGHTERRAGKLELRAGDDGAPILTGYATVYEHSYDVLGGPPYGWSETIARGAADKSVAERDDVFALYDHEGLPLARLDAKTLTLESDKMGLFTEIRVDAKSSYSMEIVSRVERGDLDAMSFAFQATRQEWNEDYTERRILEVRLFDVSVVKWPANPATVVQSRDTEPVRGMSLSLARAIRYAS